MRTRSIQLLASPVTPVGDILKILVELPALHVLGTQDAVSSTGIYQILESNISGSTVFGFP